MSEIIEFSGGFSSVKVINYTDYSPNPLLVKIASIKFQELMEKTEHRFQVDISIIKTSFDNPATELLTATLRVIIDNFDFYAHFTRASIGINVLFTESISLIMFNLDKLIEDFNKVSKKQTLGSDDDRDKKAESSETDEGWNGNEDSQDFSEAPEDSPQVEDPLVTMGPLPALTDDDLQEILRKSKGSQ